MTLYIHIGYSDEIFSLPQNAKHLSTYSIQFTDSHDNGRCIKLLFLKMYFTFVLIMQCFLILALV